MAVHVKVPISTNVIESNPDCAISGAYEAGRLIVTIDTRNQNHHQRLGLSHQTQLYWGGEYQFDAQELSGFSWPMFYRIFVREGYYFDKNNKQNHFVTSANGIDGKRKVSTVLKTCESNQEGTDRSKFRVSRIGRRCHFWTPQTRTALGGGRAHAHVVEYPFYAAVFM